MNWKLLLLPALFIAEMAYPSVKGGTTENNVSINNKFMGEKSDYTLD